MFKIKKKYKNVHADLRKVFHYDNFYSRDLQKSIVVLDSYKEITNEEIGNIVCIGVYDRAMMYIDFHFRKIMDYFNDR